ncbi:FxsA family protein [Paenibacillus physcomitrellae]|uniref:Membrane protein FxsA n=1 Tax=Paenibacillus physcomitrellae TaxID=1619311 RepID=A0ABQ1GYB1_9BACL|nr:FxsA family protein [Paenibacillus physcomitrellae]GGA52804.1 membrane protein FxsA [Paenibacillus physcomitrellae]
MRKWLFGLILLVPIVEFYGFVYVGDQLGLGKTIFLTLATSIIGGLMMQFEGRKIMADAKMKANGGQLPGKLVLNGICVFGGGILLLIPGFVTDIIGFLLVFPLTRPLLRYPIRKWVERKLKNGTITFFRR